MGKLVDVAFAIEEFFRTPSPHYCRKQSIIEPDRPMDRWIGEHLYNFKGIGYYGPTKKHNYHLDQENCGLDAQKALALYKKYWLGGSGCACYMDVTIDLCHWKDGWGTLALPDFNSIYFSNDLIKRMNAVGLSFGAWRVPGISSVTFGWTVALAQSIYPPDFKKLNEPGVFAVREEKFGDALCLAAKAAYLGLDDSFRESFKFLPCEAESE